MKLKRWTMALTGLFALVSLTLLTAAADTDKSNWNIPKDKEKFHIFLLMGQSNMAGYATLEPGDSQPVPGVVYLPVKGKREWLPAAHPLHNRQQYDRFGLGLPFAKDYLKTHPGVTVGLIPCAVGGAGINSLNKGTLVYADAIKKAMFAQQVGTLCGVLWHQGESDTIKNELSNSYEQKLKKLISDVRTDLNAPKLPFVIGNLAEFYGTSFEHNAPDRVKRINQVRHALRDITRQIPFTAFVESTGCSSFDKHMVHFDRQSYITLGKRYAAAVNQLEDSSTPEPSGKVLLDSSFVHTGPVIDSDKSADGFGKFSGPLPEGWKENFTHWTKSSVTTEFCNEGTVKYLQFNILKNESAPPQFLVPLEGIQPEKTYKLSLFARNRTSDQVKFLIRMIPAPYRSLGAAKLAPTDKWQQKEFMIKIKKKTDKPLGLFMVCDGTGKLDVVRVKLEECSSDSLLANIKRPGRYVANYIRNSRLPLGLQSGWNLDRSTLTGTAIADSSTPGISGCPSLMLRSNKDKSLTVYSEPFNVADPAVKNQVSFAIKGTGKWQAAIIAGRKVLASKQLPVASDWQRCKLVFTPIPTAWAYSIRVKGQGTLWLDAFRAGAGEKMLDYKSAGECEVALVLPRQETSDARIQFAGGKAQITYYVSGKYNDSELCFRVVDLYGSSKTLPPIKLNSNNCTGTVNYHVFPDKPLGQFRIEAWVERAGKVISPCNELVVTRLMRPKYWGKDAPDSPFGIHVMANPNALKSVKAAGCNWARLHDAGSDYIGWFWLEPRKGEWCFRDDAIDLYRNHHLKIFAQLGTAPKWASYLSKVDTGRNWISYHDRYFRPLKMADYANYVRTVVSRYQGKIDEYFVWNEPWVTEWWAVGFDKNNPIRNGYITSKQPMADYATMMKTAYDTVKSVDPSIKVSGFCTTEGGTGKKWTKGVYDAGGINYCDMVDFHYYSDRKCGFKGDHSEKACKSALGYIKKQEQGQVKKPVYMSEGQGTSMGAACGDLNLRYAGLYNHSVPWKNEENVIELADKNCRYLLSLLANGVDRIYLYSAHSYQNLARVPNYLVMFNADGYPHPMLAAHSALAYRLEGKTFVMMEELGNRLYAYLFSDGKNSVAVISGMGGAKSRDINCTLKAATTADLFGNPLPNPVYSGTLIYIEAPTDTDSLRNSLTIN